jgi:hypothetical protein
MANSETGTVEILGMTGRRILFATALLACVAFGQSTTSPSRTFYFSHAATPQILQEAVNTIRSVGNIRDVTSDAAKQAITVTGTTDQLSLAAWICNELDQTPTPRQALVQHDYTGSLPAACSGYQHHAEGRHGRWRPALPCPPDESMIHPER